MYNDPTVFNKTPQDYVNEGIVNELLHMAPVTRLETLQAIIARVYEATAAELNLQRQEAAKIELVVKELVKLQPVVNSEKQDLTINAVV